MSNYLDPRALAAQSHAVLAASVADGAEEIARLKGDRDRAIYLLSEASRAVSWFSGPSHKLALDISEFLAPFRQVIIDATLGATK